MKTKGSLCRVISLVLVLCMMVGVLSAGFTVSAAQAVTGSLDKTNVTSSVTVKAADNEGVSYDINGYRKDKDGVRYIYLFMPSRADLSQLNVTFSDGSVETMDLTNPIDCNLNNGTAYKMVAMQSKIPTLYLQIDESRGTIGAMNSDPAHDTKCYGALALDVPDELAAANGWKTSYTDDDMNIKGRGNTTWGLPKKPYQIKLSSKQNILGMGKHKTWVILANDGDRSLIRNKLAYDLADELGMSYSPQCEFVDVFMNGEYKGNYLLSEKTEVGTNRVEIQDLEDDEATYEDWVTGGYLLEYDRLAYSEATMIRGGSTGMPITVKSPEVATAEQKSYIQTFVNDMEAAICSADGYNSKGKYYTDYIDAESMCKLNWVNEIFKNGDYFYGSTYFYKDVGADSLMYAGPVWDFDITLANACANAGAGTAERQANLANPQGWWVRTVADGFGKMMFQHQDFIELNQKVYQEEVQPLLSKLAERAQEEADFIRESADMNFIVWDVLKNGHTWSTPNTATTYQGEVDFVKNYLSVRSDWIDYAMASEDDDDDEHGLTLEGMGTEINPYLIKTPEDLKQVATVSNFNNNFKDKYFLLTNDIDMSGIDWTPICATSTISGGNSFAGIFDGNYYEIKNLTVPGGSNATYGLFGMVSGTVKNLGLNHITASASANDCRAGGLVGTLNGGTVENCYIVNSSIASGARVAGTLVGQSYNGTVKGCYSYNSTAEGTRKGELVGDNEDDNGGKKGNIINCYTDGSFRSANVGNVTGGQEKVPAASFQDGTVVAAMNANAEGFWKQGAEYPVFAKAPYVPQPPVEELDYTALQAAYDEAAAYDAADYTAASYERLNELMQIAKGYLDGTMGSDISQDEIDILTGEIQEAIANLEEKPLVDKTDLQAAYGEAAAYDAADYTAESYAVLKGLMNTAEQYLADTAEVTQDAVDQLAADIRAAIENLIEVTPDDQFVLYSAQIVDAESGEPITSVGVNQSFKVVVNTGSKVQNIRLFNTYSMGIAAAGYTVQNNADGSKTFTLTVQLGTAGVGRQLVVAMQDDTGRYHASENLLSIDVKAPAPTVASVSVPETCRVGMPVEFTVVTDTTAANISVYNTYGLKMGLLSSSYQDVDGQRVWTLSMKIGTAGERTFIVKARNSRGIASDGVETDMIRVTYF